MRDSSRSIINVVCVDVRFLSSTDTSMISLIQTKKEEAEGKKLKNRNVQKRKTDNERRISIAMHKDKH